jgi:hypothetical protein
MQECVIIGRTEILLLNANVKKMLMMRGIHVVVSA